MTLHYQRPKRAYAWNHREGKNDEREGFVAALESRQWIQ